MQYVPAILEGMDLDVEDHVFHEHQTLTPVPGSQRLEGDEYAITFRQKNA